MRPRKMRLPEVFEKAHKLAEWHVEQCGGEPDIDRWREHLDLFDQRNRAAMSDFDVLLAATYAEAALRYCVRYKVAAKPEVMRFDGTLVKCGLWAGSAWGNVKEVA